MKIIAIEEHFATPEIMAAWTALPAGKQDVAIGKSQGGAIERRLYDLAHERIQLMSESGVDMQVLSLGTPGVQSLDPEPAMVLARSANDLLSETIRKVPDRFQGFAVLPTPSPKEAARELERAVVKLGLNGAMLYGRTGDKNLDHPDFIPIFETAAALRVPITLHPQTPVTPVRNAYYSGFEDQFNDLFAGAGIGWHYETGVQVLRLILSGIFDRCPNLQLILGHWGELILFFLERVDLLSPASKLQRPVSEYFRHHISVTPSGLLSPRYLRWATELLGSKRIIFATDYPYQIKQNGESRHFLETADLSEQEKHNIAHANWERMCAAIKR
ncbi:MAG: amidohydrolase [Hymenobacter sp.]|nr:MAG: amidohydrolase [Hymenobacter sp.]